jgi:hypothetical protein
MFPFDEPAKDAAVLVLLPVSAASVVVGTKGVAEYPDCKNKMVVKTVHRKRLNSPPERSAAPEGLRQQEQPGAVFLNE